MDDPPLRLAFDFAKGTVRRNALAGTEPCTICLRNQSEHEKLKLSRDTAVTACHF